MKRLQSITLFFCIAVLLTAKAGFTFWQTRSELHSESFRADRSAQQLIEPEKQRSMKPSATALADSGQVRPPLQPSGPQHQPANAADSWAMLEAYLIPDAGAASAPQADMAAIEDPTLTSLRRIRAELDQRSHKLDQRAHALAQAEEKLKQRIAELQQLEASIQQRLADESKIKNKKIKRLTAVYEGMKPQSAAPVIAKMKLATVVKIFLLMDEKKVGKILSFLPPDQAVAISQALTRQISSVK